MRGEEWSLGIGGMVMCINGEDRQMGIYVNHGLNYLSSISLLTIFETCLNNICMKYVKLLVVVFVFLSSCEIVPSPQPFNYYFPLDKSPKSSKFLSTAYFHWPYNKYGVRVPKDTILYIQDLSPTGIKFGLVGTARSGKVLFMASPRIEFGQFVERESKVSLGDSGISIVGTEKYTVPYLGVHVYLAAQYTTQHFILGMGSSLLSYNFMVPRVSWPISFATDADLFHLYQFFVFGNQKIKFFFGPHWHVFQASSGINLGTVFFNKGKEKMRILLGISMSKDSTYTKYNVYPYAFNAAIWYIP